MALDRAKRVAERLKPLLARREVSEQQVFDADLAVTQAKLQLQTAEAQLRVMMIGPKPEAVAEAEAKVKTAEGLVEFSKAHLDYHTIRSPIDGVLDSLTCHPGQTIAIGTPIGEVVDTRQILASVYLPGEFRPRGPGRATAQVRTVDSRPDASGCRGRERCRPRKERLISSAGLLTPRPETCRSTSWSITRRGC